MKGVGYNKNSKCIDDLIYDLILIEPLKKIISSLEKGGYRDCDIKWLNEKLEKYTNFTMETLNKNIKVGKLVSDDAVMNTRVKNRFLKCFKTILNYFESVE